MTRGEANRLAKQIAADLFTEGGTNRKAKRLVMESQFIKYQAAGWSEGAMADRIADILMTNEGVNT